MIQNRREHLDFAAFHSIRELGTDDGRFMAAVARRFGVGVIGYEVNPSDEFPAHQASGFAVTGLLPGFLA